MALFLLVILCGFMSGVCGYAITKWWSRRRFEQRIKRKLDKAEKEIQATMADLEEANNDMKHKAAELYQRTPEQGLTP